MCRSLFLFVSSADPKDEQKLSFIMQHFQGTNPFDEDKGMEADVRAALEWMQQRSARQVIAERERVINEIEKLGKRMWTSGICDEWLDTCSHGVREV